MKIELTNNGKGWSATAILNHELINAPMIELKGYGITKQEAKEDLGTKLNRLVSDLTQLMNKNNKIEKPYKSKRDAWEIEYRDFVDWEDFKGNWFFCSQCGEYVEEPCICYAR